jgi:phosphinothricin acetyltransferase
VRAGTGADLPGIAAIYTHYVLNTTITFNTQVRTPAAWRERFERNVTVGPYDLLVATATDDEVVGFVETVPFRPKPAYARSAELSIYVAPDAVGHGVGSALLSRLVQRLAASEFHRLFAIVALPNDASVAFHERHGFALRGTLTEAGHKFGEYLDVAYFELPLD